MAYESAHDVDIALVGATLVNVNIVRVANEIFA